jgi:hypothetical protein
MLVHFPESPYENAISNPSNVGADQSAHFFSRGAGQVDFEGASWQCNWQVWKIFCKYLVSCCQSFKICCGQARSYYPMPIGMQATCIADRAGRIAEPHTSCNAPPTAGSRTRTSNSSFASYMLSYHPSMVLSRTASICDLAEEPSQQHAKPAGPLARGQTCAKLPIPQGDVTSRRLQKYG